MWTIEWITDDGTKTLTNHCDNAASLSAAYYYHYLPELKRVNGEPVTKRRKLYEAARRDEAKRATKEENINDDTTQAVKEDVSKARKADEEPSGASQAPTAGDQDESVDRPSVQEHESTEEHVAKTTTSDLAPQDQKPADATQHASKASQTQDTDELEPPANLHFYLHRPQTSSRQPVLIPVSAKSTLGSILNLQVVLEFPTLYVLSDPPSQLPPDKYMLEEEYDKQNEEQGEIVPDLPTLKPDEEETSAVGRAIDLDAVDESRVLDVLKKDIGGLASL